MSGHNANATPPGHDSSYLGFPSSWYPYSNRKPYEKLEIGVTPIKRATSIFLIVKKTHFIQGIRSYLASSITLGSHNSNRVLYGN